MTGFLKPLLRRMVEAASERPKSTTLTRGLHVAVRRLPTGVQVSLSRTDDVAPSQAEATAVIKALGWRHAYTEEAKTRGGRACIVIHEGKGLL